MLFQKYLAALSGDLCPTIRQLADLVGQPVEAVLAAHRALWERGELCGVVGLTASGEWDGCEDDDVAAEDVPVLCEELGRQVS